MKKVQKRLLAGMLVLAMAFSLVGADTFVVFAEEAHESEEVTPVEEMENEPTEEVEDEEEAEAVEGEDVAEVQADENDGIMAISAFDEGIAVASLVDDYTSYTQDTLVYDFSCGSSLKKSNTYNDSVGYGFRDQEYNNTAKGWSSNIYYPRTLSKDTPAASYVENGSNYLQIKSKVWTETENTGYGVYTYENTSNLAVALPAADYTVEVTFVNPTKSAYKAYVKAENITKVSDISVSAGGTKTVSFTSCLIEDCMNLAFLANSSATSISAAPTQSVYISKVKITRQATNAQRADGKPTVFIASDSTVQSYDQYYYPQTGWGQVLAEFFGDHKYTEVISKTAGYSQSMTYEVNNAVVENRAIGGRSSYSFIIEGKLDDLLEDVRPGDYVLIQWGHNDATYSRPNRYVSAADFPKWIQYYIDGAVQRGATPVLVTPVARYSYSTNSDGSLKTYNSNFEAYRQAMINISKQQGVALVDLTQRSIDVANDFGIEGGKLLWLFTNAGDYPGGAYKNGSSDSTHLQRNGALKFAQCVAAGIKDAGNSKKYTNENYASAENKAALAALATLMDLRPDIKVTGVNNGTAKEVGYSFDFNYNSSATQSGWLGVNQNQYYSKSVGYGWTTIPNNGRVRGNNGVASNLANMAIDFCLGEGTFAVDIPNGDYRITIYAADLLSGTSTIKPSYWAEDEAIGGISCKQSLGTLQANVRVTDGQLNLKVGGANAYINGLTIAEIIKAPTGLVETEASYNSTTYTALLPFNGVDGAASYNYYVKSTADSSFKLERTFEAAKFMEGVTEYGAISVPMGMDYQYYVTAVTEDGFESAPTNTITVHAHVGAEPSINESDARGTRETLKDRAVSAIRLSSSVKGYDTNGNVITDGVYVSWRAFEEEFSANKLTSTFDVYVNDSKVASGLKSTNVVLKNVPSGATVKVVGSADASVNGGLTAKSVKILDKQYSEIKLSQPAACYLPNDSSPKTYIASDMSVGDVDADGVLELVVKWDALGKDNSQSGYTAPCIIDTYDVDWNSQSASLISRIDLGVNIRAGAHYTQFQVWDYDGDGKAELACKTADGSTIFKADGTIGGYVGKCPSTSLPTNTISKANDYRNTSGYILSGPEYFTMFNLAEGTILDTVDYVPARGNVSNWGDGYGNRVDRFLSATAYLDGVHPFAVMCRGYYTRTALTAYGTKDTNNDGVGDKIYVLWKYDTDNGDGPKGQGNHNLSVADVDNDGMDEIIYGSSCYDNDGTLKYSTNLGHGDAMHVSDWISSNPGLEVMEVHEEWNQKYQVEIHDAATGKILIGYAVKDSDVGRGVAADIDPTSSDAEFWASSGPHGEGTGEWNSTDSSVIATAGSSTSSWNVLSQGSTPAINATLYWDGDLLAEIQDHTFDSAAYAPISTYIGKWNYETGKTDILLDTREILTVNGTKGNVGIIADLTGDWRDEFIARCSADNSKVRLYQTTYVTDYVIPCSLDDLQYREALAWENVAYNQPPHTSYLVSKGLVTAQISTANSVSGKDAISIAFTPANDGTTYGHEVVGYNIYRKEGSGSYQKIATVNKDELSSSIETPVEITDEQFAPYKPAKLAGKKFDFGSGNVASGYTEVSASTAYSKSLGYGFTSTNGLSNKSYGNWGSDKVLNDSVLGWITDGSVEFKVDLPNGTYDVTYTLANGSGAVYDQVTAEGVAFTDVRRSNNDKQATSETVTVKVTDGQLNIVNAVSKSGYAAIYFTGITIEENADAYAARVAEARKALEDASKKDLKGFLVYTDNTVKNGTEYTYKIAAVVATENGQRESFASRPEKIYAGGKVSYEEVKKFDFGIASNVSASGWTTVTMNAKGKTSKNSALGVDYTKARGWGFTNANAVIEGRTESVAGSGDYPTNVVTDFALMTGQTFVVDVANGDYLVKVMTNCGIGATAATVDVEGTTATFDANKSFTIQEYRVTVKDGQLTITDKSSLARIGAIEVYKVKVTN